MSRLAAAAGSASKAAARAAGRLRKSGMVIGIFPVAWRATVRRTGSAALDPTTGNLTLH